MNLARKWKGTDKNFKGREGKQMTEVTLGKTGITVNKNGFGALPIQRISKEDAVKLLRRAYDGGMHFF